MIGIAASILSTIAQALVPTVRVLGSRDGVWLDTKLFKTEGGTKVIQIVGSLNFLVQSAVRYTDILIPTQGFIYDMILPKDYALWSTLTYSL